MIWKRESKPNEESLGPSELAQAVQGQLPDADKATVDIVIAIAGLLGAVAYADRQVDESEKAGLLTHLERIHGLDSAAARAISETLCSTALDLSTAHAPRFTRALRELANRELRLEVLSVLVDLAAADGSISVTEVNMLRQLTKGLGLTQDHYNDIQARHRDKLSVL